LAVLEDYPKLHPNIAIDHMWPETLPAVAQGGYQTALTLQEGKSSVAELRDLLERNPLLTSSLIINGDNAYGVSRPS
jgi:predicted metal-dependent TIM-barrel fold hydrolase